MAPSDDLAPRSRGGEVPPEIYIVKTPLPVVCVSNSR